jgi:hypothetical protein
VQQPKTYKQYEIPAVPAVVKSKVLLRQHDIMAAFVHNNSSFFSLSRPANIQKNNVTQFTVYSVWSLAADTLRPLPKASKLPTYSSTY